MREFDIVNEANMGQKVLSDVMANQDLKLGFELEFFIKELPNFTEKPTISIPELITQNDPRMVTEKIRQNFELPYGFFNTKIFNEAYNQWKTEIISKFATVENYPIIAAALTKDYIKRHKKDAMSEITDLKPKSVLAKVNEKIMSNPEKVIKYTTDMLEKGLLPNLINHPITNQYYFGSGTLKDIMNRIKQFGITPVNGWKDKKNGIFYEDEDEDDDLNFGTIKHYLKKRFGFKFSNTINDWRLVEDGSLNDYADNHDCIGVELISPPLPMDEALSWMEKLFTMINDSKGKMFTTVECGFHMGISYKNKTATNKIDKLKLALFLGDEHVLSQFKRLGFSNDEYYSNGRTAGEDSLNTLTLFPSEQAKMNADFEYNYAESTLLKLKYVIRNNIRDTVFKNNINKIIKLINTNISINKYSSINYTKLNQGYIEIRSAGGKDYTKDLQKMKNMAARYGRAMLIALDPEAYKQEYYKKLYTLIYNGLHGQVEYKNKAEGEDPLIQQAKQHFGHFYQIVEPSIKSILDNPKNVKKACDDIFNKMKRYSGDHEYNDDLLSDTMKTNIDLYKGFGIKKFLLLLKQRGFLSIQDTKKIYKKFLDYYGEEV